MVFIALCVPVFMMLLMLGMDVFENFMSQPPAEDTDQRQPLAAGEPERQVGEEL
ncbi:hypothetical protein J7E96_36545 [Streptomyces sp. ISL-96]|uniref:hypothetical protein n=1 Tax=Streptomyces sp. ISL-96 TaxID=2819191 RepID=UPI001BEBBE99|nr:hypothetical protein [Streptomyces sp. ISL-96]MBT2493906.1 hypothetical protein [Streptomyces sp. ISL-96]